MARGKAKSTLLGIQGVVGHKSAPNWGFIYSTSLTKDANWNLGDRVVLPDGRVFRYAKTGAANYTLNNDFGCRFASSVAQAYTTVDTATIVGDKTIKINENTHSAFAKDELRGGYVIVYKSGGGGYTQFRGIIGNPAVAADTDFTIELDAPLDVATLAGTTGIEVWHNPYVNLASTSSHAFAGKPAVQITAALTYFWVQTWGLCWLAHNSSTSAFSDTNQRACFRHDGSYEAEYGDDNRAAENCSQIAGYVVVRDAGPLLMLTLSP